ncbi:histidine ammonia-lyase [Ignatzschineria rhizosphaerae]|uniref:Histidine ammonia-lyase n=1 Tax=Ignatzschineria rhizosphaerae TaxID=2923279 RepID=A0ABY3X4B4_9GAMM|nr:histidine ammonia-lyase [Ignatzschineria rhizosphaerae]UNM96529.1 histidine ammonia-lyase [Ignatzschineria rhizosphaerae]
MSTIKIDGNHLTLEDIINVARHYHSIELTSSARKEVELSRQYVDELVASGEVVYGITTGFGNFSNVHISKDEARALQKNLIISHSCGIGECFSTEIVRAIMLLRINNLAKGFSGIRLSTLNTLIEMLNKKVHPRIYEKGSLGASGDLVPLAHMVLPMIGEGEAEYQGEMLSGIDAMKRAGISPIELTSKEGLALINGTQVMTAVGALTVYDAIALLKANDIATGLTMEALNGITDPFIPELHALRPHPGQGIVAANLLTLLKGSERTTHQGELRVQDAYSLRCAPQIQGASYDALAFVKSRVEIEINSVTDNPIILRDKKMGISGGHFHGQPMALAFDFLGIALAEIANVSERRIERLVNPALNNELPAFLTEHGGLHSGYMIVQYAAASLVSENKVLAHPASVDSIPSSANQEDHVSMGTIAARKALDIFKNAKSVVGMELMLACQAIDLNKQDSDKALGRGTKAAYDIIRSLISPLSEDRVTYIDMHKAIELIDDHFIEKVEFALGEKLL